MEKGRSENNAAVISSLDSLKNYAARYHERENTTEEEKKKEETIVKENVKKATKMTIQEQIAETLRLAKEKETEKLRVGKEFKLKKEEDEKIVSAIQEFTESEWLDISYWEESKIDFYTEEIQMEILAQETQAIIEKEEKRRKEKEQLLEMLREKERENQRLAEEAKLKVEQEMKAKIMEELDKIRQLQECQSLKIKEDENKKDNEREIARQKEVEDERMTQMKDEEERKRKEYLKIQKVSEEAKKMTQEAALKAMCNEESSNQMKQENNIIEHEKDVDNKDMFDEKKQRGEEIRLILEGDRKIASAILEKRRLEEEEFCKIRKEAETRRSEEIEQQKKKDHQIKIDKISPTKQENTHKKEDRLERPKKSLSSNPLARKFEELALLAINENQLQNDLKMKRQKSRLKKQSILNKSKQILNKISQKLRRSQNIEHMSKENITENNGFHNVEINIEEERKQAMQNYLISQVLFDGKEDVKSMPVVQEMEITECENRNEPDDDFELKKQQAFFDAYKQNMEEYLNFVCEGKERKSVVKKETQRCNKIDPNCLDVNIIKRQFEEYKDYKPEKAELNLDVRKLSSSKLSFADKRHESVDQTKKTCVPVIIDKAAFDRTVGLFEQDKLKEENEKKLAEIKIKKQELINVVKNELRDLGLAPSSMSKRKQKDINQVYEKKNINETKVNIEEKEDVAPKWIQVFLEKSKKTSSTVVRSPPNKPEEKEMKESVKEHDDSNLYQQTINSMLELIDNSEKQTETTNQDPLKLEMCNKDDFLQVKEGFEKLNHSKKQKENEEKVKSYPGFQTKMFKVKSMFSNKNEMITKTTIGKKELPIETHIIRNKFENNCVPAEIEKSTEVYRPKKKLINVPNVVDEPNAPSKKTEKLWKWKQAHISEPNIEKTHQEEMSYIASDSESSTTNNKEFEEFSAIEKEIDQVMFLEELIKDNKFDKEKIDMENVQAYLDLIEESNGEADDFSQRESILSSGSSYFKRALNLDTIKEKLSGKKCETKTAKGIEIGAVTHNFENFPGEIGKAVKKQESMQEMTKLKKTLFERQDEKRNPDKASSEKVKRKIIENPFIKYTENCKETAAVKKDVKPWKPKAIREKKDILGVSRLTKLHHSSSLQSLSMISNKASEPEEIQTSHEKQRFVPKIRTYSDSDIEDILNYENSYEIVEYEKELREQYILEDSDSSQEAIHETDNKKTDSFANLMNILTVMRKTNLSRSVSNSKSSLLENMSQKKISCSQVNIPEVSGTNQNLRKFYENGPESLKLENHNYESKMAKKVNTKDKQECWENLLNKNKESDHSSSNLSNDIGKIESRRNFEKPSQVRRTNSCRDISWERVSSELDEETMLNISESKQMAKEMFESTAPKYKFGGSLANISKKSSMKQNIKITKEEFDGRKWVLDSINKHFDVILEEGEEESDSAYDDSDGEEDWSEIENEEESKDPDDITEKKSSVQMQGLLKSVVSKIRSSCSNLNDKDVVSCLKTQLEQR